MRRRTGFLGAMTAAFLLSGGIALAQGNGGAERIDRLFGQIDLDGSGTITIPEMRAAAAARFAALDRNGDGTVQRDERQTTREDRMRGRFLQADRDGNGMLDAAEMIAVAQQSARDRIERLDRNGDGMLSLEELERSRSTGGGARPSSAGMTLRELDAQMMAMFRKADTNGDGIVTLREATEGSGR